MKGIPNSQELLPLRLVSAASQKLTTNLVLVSPP